MKSKRLIALSIAVSAALATGCASVDDSQTTVAPTDVVSKTQYEQTQRRVSELEARLAEKEAALARSNAVVAETGSTDTNGSDLSLFPPNPKAGECYARILIPAEYRTETETVLTRDASERIEIIPATYETVDERVLVKQAATRLEVVPATYETVTERVMIKPERTELVEVPARYEMQTERVLDKAAHTVWKKGPAQGQSGTVLSQATNDTGEIMCLVEVPATYKTISKRVLVAPARTEEKVIPAVYDTITRKVVKTEATTRQVTIPAEYDTVSVTKLVRPASERRIEIPATYDTVNRSVKTTDERMEWNQVMCEVNMTRDNVTALQGALQRAGYYKGPIDGIIGPQTLSAARGYAVAKNLPAGSNYISMEVIRDLGLKI
ncbi:MAG: peptidoglycan-binding protein [Pseudomonadota bacterium]